MCRISRCIPTLMFLLLANFLTYSQELIKRTNRPLPGVVEEYSCLKNDPSIKEGPYKLKIDGIVHQIGFYKNNQRSGTWQVFLEKKVLEFKYNYDTKKIYSINKIYFMNPKDTNSYGPIYLGGESYFLYQIANKTKHPSGFEKNMRPGRYQSIVQFYIDSLGIPQNFYILKSSNNEQLDFEAIYYVKSIATSDFSYIPGKYNGKFLAVPLRIPINFIF